METEKKKAVVVIAKSDNEVSYKDKVINIADTMVNLDNLSKITILTTDKGPFVDDMALFLVQSDGLVIVPSEHPAFMGTIADLNKDFPIDYHKVIKAQSCVQNQEFVLWQKI